jgi:hypothetical protein
MKTKNDKQGSKALFGAYKLVHKRNGKPLPSQPLRFQSKLNQFEVGASVSDPYFLSSDYVD